MAIKILTFSSLYPNSQNPGFGIFVENRLRELLKTTDVEAVVVAPVPYFFNLAYGSFRRVEKQEERNGIPVLHPKFLNIPKIGMSIAPILMAISVLPTILKLRKNGYQFDLIDAHYFYPDGTAAALLSQWLKIPLVITARGTDLNLIADYLMPRTWIKWAAGKAQHLITVSTALKNKLTTLDVAPEKISVLRNGVDLALFRPPDDREAQRMALGMNGKTLISVGNLVELKGHNLVIEAIRDRADISLVIVGDGPQDAKLRALVSNYQMESRVRFIKGLPQNQLKDWYGAADILVLASSREGWPNVLLEALACGTPVIATKVGGVPEIIKDSVGSIVGRNSKEIGQSIDAWFIKPLHRESYRQYAEKFSWLETSKGQLSLFNKVTQQ